MREWLVGVIVMSMLLAVAAPAAAGQGLPRDTEYQRVLREYLAGLAAADLALRGGGGDAPVLAYDESFFQDPDNRYRLHVLTMAGARGIPGGRGARNALLVRDPEHFLLEQIESEDGVRMWTGAAIWDAAHWVRYPSPGNPHYGNHASQRRVAVAAAVDLMMTHAELNEGGRIARHDFLGGVLVPIAAGYHAAKPALPERVRRAFEQGLEAMLGHLEARGPQGVHANMDMFALMSAGYIREAIDDPAIDVRVEAHVQRLLDTHFYPAGYVDHGHGYDPSYNGRSIDHLVYTALAFDLQPLPGVVDKAFRLRAHMSFPEPVGERGRFKAGPTHFATTMSRSAPHEQSGGGARDVGGAAISDHAVHLLFKGRGARRHEPGHNVPEQITRDNVEAMIERVNRSVFERVGEGEPPVWSMSHYRTPAQRAAFNLPDGTYERLRAYRQRQDVDPLTRPIYLRGERFIRRFPADPAGLDDDRRDTFLIARFDSYATVIHTGRLSTWGGISGFGGGALSVFWTPDAGPALMGRNNNRPYDAAERDTWDNWRMWLTHAISGANEQGAFSSARERFPDKSYTFYDERGAPVDEPARAASSRVRVSGRIGADHDGGRTTENDHITGEVRYERTFDIEAAGLSIETTLTSDGKDVVSELYEALPVFASAGSPYRALEVEPLRAIEFYRAGRWVEASGETHDDVERIHIRRFDGAVEIEFDSARTVRLAPEPSRYGRVILIDLLGAQRHMPDESHVAYTIRPVAVE